MTIEELLYSNYIKYERLNKMAPLFQPGTFMDIYIDMYSLIKSIYNNRNLRIDNYTVITSSIINLVAHYRKFFTYLNIDTTFYIVNSQNIAALNKQFYPEYNMKMEYLYANNKQIDEFVFNNLDLLQLICPYITDVHFIESVDGYETGSIINYIRQMKNPDNERTNLIITKDIYNYQLAQFPNTFILRPKKTKEGDVSFIINHENIYRVFLSERNNTLHDTFLSPGLFSSVLALSNVPERNIKSLLNINSAIKLLESCIDNFKISNSYNYYVKSIWDAIQSDPRLYNLGQTGFEYRFKAIDIIFLSSVYSNTAECQSLSFNNLYDPNGVRTLNDKYFTKMPLDLEGL